MRRIVAALAVLVLAGSACAATATATSYAVLALVGDKIDVVTYQPQIGSKLDTNTHMSLTMSADEFDTVALRTVNRALKANAPGAPVALLAASTADAFQNQAAMFSGDHLTLPPEIDAAIHREGATTLVLITKHHGEARMQVQDGYIGNGKIEGLGFYVDSDTRLMVRETGDSAVGFLAPFVYVDVSLIDIATGTVTRRVTIAAGRTVSVTNNPDGVHPWDALSTEAKVAALKSLLAAELNRVLPALITGDASPQVAPASAARP